MPSEKLDRCVAHVMEQGQDESSAYAICRVSIGLASDGSDDEKIIAASWDEIVRNVAPHLEKKQQAKFPFDADGLIFGDGIDISSVPLEIEGLIEGEYKSYLNPLTGERSRLKITAEDVDAAIAHFKARKQRHPERDLVIDYEHQTFLTTDEAPAAGWIEDVFGKLRDGKKVLMLKLKEWTARAEEYLKNKEYRYLSPVFVQNGTDKETGKKERCILLGAGLTNEPLFDALLPIVSSQKIITGKESAMNKLIARLREVYQLAADATEDQILAKFNQVYDGTTKVVAAKQKVAGILGLKPEATLEEIEAAVVVAKGHITELAKALDLKPEATVEEIKAAIVTAKAGAGELPKMAARLQALETKDSDREFDRIIGKAFEAGKILPVSKNDANWLAVQKTFAAKDLKAFEAFWDKQPLIGPVQKIPTGGESPIKGKGITEETLAVGKQLGVTKEMLEKYNTVVN